MRKECLSYRKLTFGITIGFWKDIKGVLGMVVSDWGPEIDILVMQDWPLKARLLIKQNAKVSIGNMEFKPQGSFQTAWET